MFTMLLTLERGVNCKQNTYNISHHIQSVLPHYLWKVKVKVCDKLQTSCLMKRNISSHMVRQTMLMSSFGSLWGWRPNFEYTHSAEKAHDTTLDDENASHHVTSVLVTALCNQPEAFASDLSDDQSRYLLLKAKGWNHLHVRCTNLNVAW